MVNLILFLLFSRYVFDRKANIVTIPESSYERQEVGFPQSYRQAVQSEPCKTITPLELLGLLRVGPSAALDALELILQQSVKKPDSSLRKVSWLNRMDEFRAWYHNIWSSLLLVEGFLDTSPSERISALSIFNASFILNIASNPSYITLFFFAGLYDSTGASRDADFIGPCRLIRSLIAQLLAHESLPPPDLGFVTPQGIEACQQNNLLALCELFRRLILQIPADMQVFCILDGLVVYECEPRWSADIDYVASLLETLVGSTGVEGTPVVKIMLTFVNRSLQISKRISKLPDLWIHIPLVGRRM
ncbi:hypothetical protein N7490_003279 [Penicillium lividum]|nr:hypothetical protein N7490_003279 [Penicillium lividum]